MKIKPYKGLDGRYHILYKTRNIHNGKIYIGVHSTFDINDGYIGCGIKSPSYVRYRYLKTNSAFINACSKYGYHSFISEPILFFDNHIEAFEFEKIIVCSEFIKSPLNYNSIVGGKAGNRRFKKNKKRKRRKGIKNKTYLAVTPIGVFESDFLSEKLGVSQKILRDSIFKGRDDLYFIYRKDFLFPQLINRHTKPVSSILTDFYIARHEPFCFKSPDGDIWKVKNLKKFCLNKKLSRSAMSKINNGNYPYSSYKGWTLAKCDENKKTYEIAMKNKSLLRQESATLRNVV